LEFNSYIILNLHALLADNLLQDQNSIGRLRSIPVGIHKSAYTPLAIPQLISDQFELILQKVKEIRNPFEQAFFIMVHFPYLQPFDDVNKRTSRLAANIPFFKSNLSPLSFVDVPNEVYVQAILGVYELNRIELLKDVFIWAYERSAIRYASIRQTVGEPDAFRTRYRNEIRELVTEIISNNLSPKEGSERIKRKANEILKTDQNKFVEYVDSELLGVHEGSFARFRVSPAEFHTWKENWSR
jgi:Fic family protein